jgi:hypothetical protein
MNKKSLIGFIILKLKCSKFFPKSTYFDLFQNNSSFNKDLHLFQVVPHTTNNNQLIKLDVVSVLWNLGVDVTEFYNKKENKPNDINNIIIATLPIIKMNYICMEQGLN